MYLCTWCNIDVHLPIGNRNHNRRRLYGKDPTIDDKPAIDTTYLTTSLTGVQLGVRVEGLSSERVSVLSEVLFDVEAWEAWSVLSGF